MIISKSIPPKLLEIIVISIYIFLFLALLPLSLAVAFSYYLTPVVAFFHERLKIPYLLSILLLLVIVCWLLLQFILLVVDAALIFIPILYDYISTLQLPPFFSGLKDQLSTFLNALYKESIPTFFNAFLSSLGQIMNVMLFILGMIFALLQSRTNRTWFFSIVIKPYRSKWLALFKQVAPYIKYFIMVEFIIFSITFSCLTVFFTLLQFPHPLHLALIIALIDLLPMLGLALFFIPLCIMYIIKGHIVLFILSALFYVFLITTRQLIDSKLWAKTLQIKMAHSFFITAASILLFNFYGLFLAPIIVAILLKYKRMNYF